MDRRIEVALAQLESGISARLDIHNLAREVNLSASRLRHLFKNETGRTPAQHLRRLRMQRAELLLRTTFLTVKEISNRVGITNSSHFVREFRKVYGTSPTLFRASLVQESIPRSRKRSY